MTDTAVSETPKSPAQTQPEPVVAPVAVPSDDALNPAENTTHAAPVNSPAQAEQSEAMALALSNLEQQLGQLNAHILAMQQQLIEAASEPNEQTEEARGTLAVLRAAASEVQSTIAEVKSSRRPISAAVLTQLSTRIGGIITEATEESAELGNAVTESRSNTAQRQASARTSSASQPRPSVAARVNAAILGRNAAHAAQPAGHGDDDDDENNRFVRVQTLPDEQKPVIWKAVRGTVSPRTINSIAQFAGRNRIFGVDEKAARTAERLTQQATSGNAQQREVVQGEMLDAVARHVGGRTFVGQEIDDALATLRRNSAIVSAHGNFGYYLTTDNVREALEANGAFTSGYSMFNSYEANRAWSARNVRRIDENADGQLSAIEITHALQDARATMARANAAYAAKERAAKPSASPAPNPNRGRIVSLDGYGDIKIESARAKLEANGVKIDTNGNGVSYTECLAAITRWNDTHDDNWRPQTTAPRRPAAARRQPD